jgi:hypothetical protein
MLEGSKAGKLKSFSASKTANFQASELSSFPASEPFQKPAARSLRLNHESWNREQGTGNGEPLNPCMEE